MSRRAFGWLASSLTPKKIVKKSQAYFWSEGWQEAEQEANDDIAAGRVRDAESTDGLVAALEQARKQG